MGFSQGGAIALLSGLVGTRDLAGIVALSTWVPLNHKLKEVSMTTCFAYATALMDS